MVSVIMLVITLLLFLLLSFVIGRVIIRKQPVIGRPPIPVGFFILAKALVLVNLAFLLVRGFEIQVSWIFQPAEWVEWIAIVILLSSCLLTPNYINLAAFAGAGIIHHFIMIREEPDLISKYGEAYKEYAKRVRRYITL